MTQIDTLEQQLDDTYEEVTFFHDEKTGLDAIIAIHDTRRGPALGGTRLRQYDTEEDALNDVLRLSKGMSYKAAAADLDLGGGKAVINASPDDKSEDLLRAYGQIVDSFNGRFRTGEDMNITEDDVAIISQETDYIDGLPKDHGGLGDPSPVTAHGVYHGIQTALDEHPEYDDDSVEDRSVLVQGAGKVGMPLVETLVENDADVMVADPDQDVVNRLVDKYGVDAVDTEDVYTTGCDVFAPCAIGGVINDDTIPQIDDAGVDIVAGSANNQLARRDHADALEDRDILYAPDYVINAGGLITVYHEKEGNDIDDAYDDAEQIADRLETMFTIAKDEDITPLAAADRYAEEQMADHGADVDSRFSTMTYRNGIPGN